MMTEEISDGGYDYRESNDRMLLTWWFSIIEAHAMHISGFLSGIYALWSIQVASAPDEVSIVVQWMWDDLDKLCGRNVFTVPIINLF